LADRLKLTGCELSQEAAELVSVAVAENLEPVATWSGPV
jgi:hypothetical protein